MKLSFLGVASLIISVCSTVELNIRPGMSLLSAVREAAEKGLSCRSIIEQYNLKISAHFLKIYDRVSFEARQLDEAYSSKSVPKGQFHCVPMLILKEDELRNDSSKPPSTFDYFKKRGAIAFAEISPNSLPLQFDYPAIVFTNVGLSDRSIMLNKQIRFQHFREGYPCSISNSIIFRLMAYRENVCLIAGSLDDLFLLSNSTYESKDRRRDSDISEIRRKTIGIIRTGTFFPPIDERSTSRIVQRLTEGYASIKNVSLNDNELTNILRHLRTLFDCNWNLPKETLIKNETFQDQWNKFENDTFTSDVLCWSVTKKRYRYQIRFVKRVAEPLFGTNDFLVLPPFIDDKAESLDFRQFAFLLSQSHYPIVQYNADCSLAGPVMFLARPDLLSSILDAAVVLDHLLKVEDNRGSDININSLTRFTQYSLPFIQRDYCGEMVLNEIVAGKPIYAYDLCGPNGICINTPRGIRCDCAPGYSGRLCHEVSSPFTIVQKCVLYPTYQTVINNLTATCPDQTSCIPSANHCLFNYCDNPHGWCLSLDEFIPSDNNSKRH